MLDIEIFAIAIVDPQLTMNRELRRSVVKYENIDSMNPINERMEAEKGMVSF